MTTIDLNCDMGEGGGFDGQLMPIVSTCNIACGGHYGDDETISKSVDLALNEGVKIGAHPAYPDKANFGRQPVDISLSALQENLIGQIKQIKTISENAGAKLHHVKPHGFLYNEIVHDGEKAQLVIEVVKKIDDSLILFVPPQSLVEELARDQLRTWREGFADRNYNADFSLVSREESNAVLTEKNQVLDRVLSVARNGKIESAEGAILSADFDTICLHSDTGNSVEIAKYLSEKLPEHNIKIS